MNIFNGDPTADTPECPAIDPNLLAHLNTMFSKPLSAKVTNPQLSQLLMVQFGVDKVLDYLTTRFNSQNDARRLPS